MCRIMNRCYQKVRPHNSEANSLVQWPSSPRRYHRAISRLSHGPGPAPTFFSRNRYDSVGLVARMRPKKVGLCRRYGYLAANKAMPPVYGSDLQSQRIVEARRHVCVTMYYPAACGPKGHGSTGIALQFILSGPRPEYPPC